MAPFGKGNFSTMFQSSPGYSSPRKQSLPSRVFLALLKIAYHLLYNQLAFAYDAVAWIVSAGEWAAWRRCAIPFLRRGSVLEIAHGTGALSLEMAAAGISVTAIDRSPAMIRIAAARIRNRKIRREMHGNPVLVRADVMHLPFRSSSFPNAVSTFPAEFILEPQAIREIVRCLESGGRLVIIPSALPEFLAAKYFDFRSGDAAAGIRKSLGLRLQPEGLRSRIEVIRRARSRVLVVVADKPAPSDLFHSEQPAGANPDRSPLPLSDTDRTQPPY
jgi:ubiquinone/menaquinone biosynthesis C-methylase UbiE